MKDTFLIVDGNSLMHRAYHALPYMTAGDVPTGAIHGFLMMFLGAVKEQNVRYAAVCFDEHGPTFRHTMYADYKAGRSATPPELISQLTLIRNVLTDMGIRWYALQGWEADDLLGTLSLMGSEAGLHPLLLTGDRDSLQLVDNETSLLFTRKGIKDTTLFTPVEVYNEYGITPEQVPDWKGLAGDSSDHISGVPGVGDKTAVKLLQKYGTLESVLEHAAEQKGKLGENLSANMDLARQCKLLATIRRDAPIRWNMTECALSDMLAGSKTLKRLQLNQVIRTIEGLNGAEAPRAVFDAAGTDAEVPAGVSRPVLLPYETVSLSGAESFTSWLQDAAAPVALWQDDNAFSAADSAGRSALFDLGGDLLTPGDDPDALLRAAMAWAGNGLFVIHDGKTLLHRLDKLGLEKPESFAWDTMLGAYLLNPQEKSYSFDALRGELPSDAAGLMSLYVWQKERIGALGMLPLMQDIEMPLSHVLQRMEAEGFTVDREFLRQLGQRYEEEIEELKKSVYDACGVGTFNLNSTQQLGKVLFEDLKLPHGKKTQKGYSTSAEVLEGIRDIAPDIIDPLLRYRQLVKLNNTYVVGLLRLVGDDGRVRSYFDQVATATGRISSSEPNLQNIPVRTEEGREIRQAFLPRSGWILLDADYSQIELRLMAHFSGDAAFLDAFRTGQDIHARTASEIFDVPMSEVTPLLRSRAKAVNFGLIYGISGFGLARNTGVTQAEAREFIKQYFAKYPGVKRFMDEAAGKGRQQGYADTLFGRRRYLPELKSDKAMVREFGKRAAMNTPVQGTAADIIKLAMVRVDEALRKRNMRSRLILQVHDELLLECPPEEADEAARLLAESMEQVTRLDVPLLAEVHRGSNWLEAK